MLLTSLITRSDLIIMDNLSISRSEVDLYLTVASYRYLRVGFLLRDVSGGGTAHLLLLTFDYLRA